MRCFEIIVDEFVDAVGEGPIGKEISKDRHDAILGKIHARPTPPDGFDYKLRASDLEWVLVEVPADPDPDIDGAEALEILLGGAE